MKGPNLQTNNPRVRLVEPNVARDAPLGVQWLAGDAGRNTLSLMGVPDTDNHPSSLAQEQQRVQDFIDRTNQLNWMIQLDDTVVGAIWIDLEPVGSVSAPAIHTMIGDPTTRGQGVGTAVTQAVIDYLRHNGEAALYSRYLTKNTVPAKLLAKYGFSSFGPSYVDDDGLEWQNVMLDLTRL